MMTGYVYAYVLRKITILYVFYIYTIIIKVSPRSYPYFPYYPYPLFFKYFFLYWLIYKTKHKVETQKYTININLYREITSTKNETLYQSGYMLQPSNILHNPKFYFWILFQSMSRFENHRVHVLLVPASHLTMASWVKKICSQNLLHLVSLEREFYADQYMLQNLHPVFVRFLSIDLQIMHHALQKCVTKTQDDYFEYRQFYIAVFSFCRLLFSKSYMRFKS